MRLNRTFKTLTLLSAAIVLAVSSCVKPEETVTSREAELSIPLNPVPTKAASQFVTVDAEGAWTLSIDFGETEEAWARVDTESGEGRRSDIVLSWDRNASEDSRSCTLTLSAGARTVSATFTQNGTSGSGGGGGSSEIKSDIPGEWLELPATDDENLYFITHDMERGGKTIRNYSYYYSPDDRLAVWVAYPLNRGLIGSGGRTDEWGYDPKVPARYQPVLFRGYDGGYDRGHQLPSADRYGSGINETTFYFTNMTPQLGSLNQKKWADLETQIRNWSYSLDTLYVVTGADIHGATKVAYDNNGAACTVPEGYFKALLGYKKGGSIGTGGYVGIAFYFEHRSYNNDIMNQSMTIDELEDRLGYDFFVNLPRKIGEEWAARVESDVDDWWY
ncbi:MAG TPA: DNA/RNA non-specific endonuclease [Candidatus Cryptobacteroides merdipullorum]|uniref:Endonuclease n=1 Tax=Candidatus Cryptobacteroides merdipullorum TaxID=2840771 RepID=A0A9D1GNQ6_9BACT|nr:DNA/RNA non-specific endonuclease [Candidatus Cryptobacteroides merdipullorum]